MLIQIRLLQSAGLAEFGLEASPMNHGVKLQWLEELAFHVIVRHLVIKKKINK